MTIMRMRQHKMVSGVLAGVAYTLGWRTWLVRLLFVLAVLCTGGTLIIVYFLMALFVPKYLIDPTDYQEKCG